MTTRYTKARTLTTMKDDGEEDPFYKDAEEHGAGARRAEKREQLQDQVQHNQQRINYDFVLLCIIRLDQCLSNINIWRTLKKILCSKFFHCVARRDSVEIMEIVHQGMCNCIHNSI